MILLDLAKMAAVHVQAVAILTQCWARRRGRGHASGRCRRTWRCSWRVRMAVLVRVNVVHGCAELVAGGLFRR